jgi:hypothetical protein
LQRITLELDREERRVDDEYPRRGLARAMPTAGLDRLAAKGAQRKPKELRWAELS